METRSNIGIKDGNKAQIIYCHWDGCPSHNGKVLKEYYSNTEKVKDLIALGDISCLKENIGSQHDFNNYPKDEVTAYHRDRGDDYNPPREVEAVGSSCQEEYMYLWDVNEEKWYISFYGERLVELTDQIINEY